MEELQLKYVEIIFDKQTPQNIGTEINISSRIDDCDGKLEYKFIVGKGGIWNTIQEFSEKSKCVWKPKTEGEYMVMVQARDKDGKKPLDYLAREEFSITNDEATDAMLNEEILSKVANDEEGDISFRGIVEDETSSDNLEFKEAVNNDQESNVVFLEVKELSKEEKETLIGEKDINEELLLSEGTERRERKKIDFEGNEEKELELINTIITDKEEYMVGEKCSIEVKMNNEGAYLYRFYIKNNDEWDVIRDYDTSNLLKYTVNEEGEKKFLVQCKMMQSTEAFEDYKIVRIDVKSIRKIEITDFKCLNKALISGEKLGFAVETNVYKNEAEKDKVVLLYKFYKLYKDGKSVCIQDYSTRNDVYYKELEAGSYRILCLVKSIFSNREYDDRAILVYDVKPYEDIKINSFVASLNSPQTTETDIRFTSEIQGGKNLLYKYKVKGPIEEDTGFTAEKEFSWKPIEAGEYEIILYVKDSEHKGEYEATKKIAFTIEEKGKKPVKILDVIVDREKKVIAGEPVNIMVNGEGGTRLQYAFTIRENKKKLEGVSYNKSNWINFIPEHAGEYEVEIMVKDQYSDKPYDANTFVHLKAMEYLPGEIDYIILPYKETHLIGEAIEFECIIQNTQDVLVKYETKINGHSVEETEFSKNKKLRFVPKIAGKYTIEVYAKNIKCKDEYDSKKQINLYVSEAPPVIETKIITNKLEFNINEEVTFEVISRGGKDVCYEFYLMGNNEWKKVQPYSKKHYYSFIPFAEGKYKILALAKSYYKKVSYEDYDQITFFVNAQSKK